MIEFILMFFGPIVLIIIRIATLIILALMSAIMALTGVRLELNIIILLLINKNKPQPVVSSIPGIGLCHPPIKAAAATPLTTNIFAYSL